MNIKFLWYVGRLISKVNFPLDCAKMNFVAGKIAVYDSSAFPRGFRSVRKQTKTNPKYVRTNPEYKPAVRTNPKY